MAFLKEYGEPQILVIYNKKSPEKMEEKTSKGFSSEANERAVL